MSKADRDNHSNQLNANNAAYWSSRGGREDDDEPSVSFARWSGPAVVYLTPPPAREFTFFVAVVTLDGEVQLRRMVVSGRTSHFDAYDAAEAIKREACHKCVYYEIRDEKGALLDEHQQALLGIKLATNLDQLQLVGRLRRAIDCREQANDAWEAYKEGIEKVCALIRALPMQAAVRCKPWVWAQARQDLVARLRSGHSAPLGDLKLADVTLRSLASAWSPATQAWRSCVAEPSC